MAKSSFILKGVKKNDRKSQESTTPTLILLYFAHDGDRLRISTGQTVKPRNWSFKAKQVKSSATNAADINMHLTAFADQVEAIYHRLSAKTGNPPTNEMIKKALKEEKARAAAPKFLVPAYEQYIKEESGGGKAKNTIMGYKTTLKHLREFEEKERRQLTFEAMDQVFYNRFVKFLRSGYNSKNGVIGLNNNSVGDTIKRLKSFLNHCLKFGYIESKEFQKFKVFREESDSTYLNEEELNHLFNLDLSRTPGKERARDLFLIGCWTGLRFSDYSQIKPENISDGKITIRTEKTGELVKIPILPVVRQILNKYEGKLPPAISNQKINLHLADIAKIAGFKSPVSVTTTNGGKKETRFVPKYDLIRSHCARRSFCTNMYKAGFPAIILMKITGHKTESAFLKYIKVDKEEAADQLLKFWEQQEKGSRFKIA